MEEQGVISNNGRRTSDHSASLAEKLLQGWALLQEHCPQCLTPLVRNRQRKMYCVACAQWVVTQSEAAEQLARERVEKDGAESSGEPSPPPLPLVPVSSSHIASASGRQEQVVDPVEPSRPCIHPAETLAHLHDLQQSSNRGNSSSTFVIPKLDYCPKTLEQVLPNVSSILIHKLEEIGNALVASQDVNEIRTIFKYHGMPKSIVSDRDPRMTSLFWQALFENLGTKLDFSSAYHPQTDGQSEIANATVLDLLKMYVSDRQSEWEKYIPLVEFAYNNTIHSSIGKAPFEVTYGKPILPPILLTKEKIFAADEFVRDIDTAYTQVQRAILRTQEKQKREANKHRR
ncbi:hypothetical protein L7F22_015338 [Adiantum nelumboides]|nr:hypothetical protein [Adiantum nelumboides]